MKPSRVAEDLEKILDWPELAREAGYCSYRLANLLDVQERALRRYFLRKFGRPTRRQLEVLREERIEQLAKAGVSEKEIAVRVHFKHASHLSRHFKRTHGITLRLWLKSSPASVTSALAFIMSTNGNFFPL